ncbi:MAG: hypothetical protein KH054_10605 [Firmicutes bacterium]|jgi:hypothetical protein|nr:hypothetical protein [Bacillota bacterium]
MTKQWEKEIRKAYPAPLTLDSVRKILRISKRKASWLLRYGYIPCENTGKRTRQYRVRVEDLFGYIKKAEKGLPEAQISVGIFNGHPTKGHRQSVPTTFSEPPCKDFREWLEKEWADVPDALRVKEVSALTGYAQGTIQRWTLKKILRSVWAQHTLVIAKEWLIEFFSASAYQIQRKSERHIGLLSKYCHKRLSKK